MLLVATLGLLAFSMVDAAGTLSGSVNGKTSVLVTSYNNISPSGGRVDVSGYVTIEYEGETYEDEFAKLQGGRLSGEINIDDWSFTGSLSISILIFDSPSVFTDKQLYVKEMPVQAKFSYSVWSEDVKFATYHYFTDIEMNFDFADVPFTLEDEGTVHCGQSNHYPTHRRIVNGDEAPPHQYPWMVHVMHVFPDDKEICGGSLLTRTIVLTAAHCVQMPIDRSNRSSGSYPNVVDDLEYFKVYLGVHYLPGAFDVYRMEPLTDADIFLKPDLERIELLEHTSFDENLNYDCKFPGLPDLEERLVETWSFHDIALIFLDAPVTLDYFKDVICLPDQMPSGTTYNTAIIAGWGLGLDATPQDTLQVATVPLVQPPQIECKTEQGDAPVEVSELILSSHQEHEHDPGICFGDSGGPYVIKSGERHFEVGVVGGTARNLSLPEGTIVLRFI